MILIIKIGNLQLVDETALADRIFSSSLLLSILRLSSILWASQLYTWWRITYSVLTKNNFCAYIFYSAYTQSSNSHLCTSILTKNILSLNKGAKQVSTKVPHTVTMHPIIVSCPNKIIWPFLSVILLCFYTKLEFAACT